MVVIDTSTPRGKVAQDWINAYVTLNIDEISRRFPECYTHRTLPASIGLPDESKEKYLERLGTLLPSLTKSEVSRVNTRPRARRLTSTALGQSPRRD